MRVPEFIVWAKEVQSRENKIMLLKGEEYTVSDEDKFKNFKSIAERTDSTTEKVALIYLLKHMDSIRNYVLHGKEASDEPIMGRIMDARNYLLLLGGIIEESSNNQNKMFDTLVKVFDGKPNPHLHPSRASGE